MTTTDSPAVTRHRPSALRKVLLAETRLFLRDPATAFFTLVLPLALLLILGSAIPAFRQPDPATGERVVDIHLPSTMIMLAVATAAFSAIPSVLATYRERGVLRRLSVTPVSPATLLGAQLLLNLATAALAAFLTILSGHLVLGSLPPAAPAWFVLAFVLGVSALFTLGLCVAALVPNGRAAGGAGALAMFPLLFFGGLWLPRQLMPEVLLRFSDFTPTGAFAQAMHDSWAGQAPQPLHLGVLVAWTLVAGAFAARAFRWE
ncbi:transport permease protein [Sphaerisporangium melleum]|uniref:Transport permease protein n=1 Tax=Sphaerisporangium melleum TaxID=321316 RepID=A0A917VN87_9ACTN|nr:ABC transporter permease [Sphaerisporangium melleum]GGL01180.1 transport permease protein [Sphaerisporangium melleum]GII71657.1 transport permease protein [Sphaerisporangium melleum]